MILALVPASVALVAVFPPQGISWSQLWLALALVWLGLAPGLMRWIGPDRPELPLFEVSCLFYAICFGLPVLLAGVVFPDSGNIWFYNVHLAGRGAIGSERALVLLIAGVALYEAAFYATRPSLVRGLPALRLGEAGGPVRRWALLGLLLAAALAYDFIPWVRTLPSIGQFLGPVLFLPLGMLYVDWRRGRLHAWIAVPLLAILVPAIVLNRLETGFLTPLLMVLLFFFFARWRVRQRPSLGLLAVALVSAVALYAAIASYRGAAEKEPQAGLAEKTRLLAEVTADVWDKPTLPNTPAVSSYYRRNRLVLPLQRLALVRVMSNVVERTPSQVPYWRGETYRLLLVSWIPRALWHGKPEERWGNAFGQRYGLLRDPSDKTSVNIPWIVETYVNFGVAGLIIGMTLIGVMMAALDAMFNRRGLSDLEAVAGLTVIFPLVYQESNLSVMCGSLLPLVLCLLAYFRLGFAAGLPARSRTNSTAVPKP